MDAWTTAAIALSAAVVGGTVEHAWARWRSRRDLLEQATFELRDALAIAVTGLSAAVQPRDGLDFDSRWGQERQRALRLLATIRVKARWIPRADTIRTEAEDLAARLGAAGLRMIHGNPISVSDATSINASGLSRAVFGPEDTLDAAVDWYRDYGFDSGRPPWTASQ